MLFGVREKWNFYEDRLIDGKLSLVIEKVFVDVIDSVLFFFESDFLGCISMGRMLVGYEEFGIVKR